MGGEKKIYQVSFSYDVIWANLLKAIFVYFMNTDLAQHVAYDTTSCTNPIHEFYRIFNPIL